MNIQNDHILSQLGHRLGLELFFDKNQQCCLLLDQSLMVSIKQEASHWLFYGMLQDQLDNQDKAFWQRLLVLNLSLAEKQAGTITYEPVSDALLYVDALSIAQLDGEACYNFLEQFVHYLEYIKEQLLVTPNMVNNAKTILMAHLN